MGRLGGIIAPLAFEWLLDATASPSAFFTLVLALAALSAGLVQGLPMETKDRRPVRRCQVMSFGFSSLLRYHAALYLPLCYYGAFD